jgi:hypothetical protein
MPKLVNMINPAPTALIILYSFYWLLALKPPHELYSDRVPSLGATQMDFTALFLPIMRFK